MTGIADSNTYLGLFSFNWLPALYARQAHLGAWATVLPDRRGPGHRLVHRVSQELLQRYQLTESYLPWVPANPWILAPYHWLEAAAVEVAIAMAAGSIRQTVSSAEVSRWVGLVGESGRGRAFRYAHDYPRLAAEFSGWLPESKAGLIGAGSVVLGLLAESALAAEAADRREPSPERIACAGATRLGLRFDPLDKAWPTLTAQARQEATVLFESLTARRSEPEQVA